ncbi:MAG: hypothetical protein NUW01_04390 [Gemmatimonadaceae bacterium]|nr:hypothetical protein [Gemmatimonadaceae bacterium]
MTEPRTPDDTEDSGLPDPADAPPPPPPPPPPLPALPAKDADRERTTGESTVPPAVAKPIVVQKPWHKRWSTRVLAALIIVPLLIFAVWAAVTLNVVYESGERYGYVQNFAKQGVVCATWEGELAETNVPGVAPEIFRFSVRDNAVAADVQASIGKRVALRYEEHRNVPTSCFGKSDHFVTGVRVEEP